LEKSSALVKAVASKHSGLLEQRAANYGGGMANWQTCKDYGSVEPLGVVYLC